MHAKSLLAAAIVCGLAGCSQQAASPPPAVQAPPPATQSVATAPNVGVDLAAIDHAVKPGDDFFAYANGTWVKTATIPADRSNTGTFFEVFEKAEQQTSDLIKNAGASNPAAGSDARRIADYYASYMDETAIDKAGLDPLKPELDAIAAIKSRADLARVLGSRLRADVDPVNATHFQTRSEER